MALDFPNSPTTGQTYTGPNGVVWAWDGTKWVSGSQAASFAPINSPVFTGDPQAPTPPPGDSDGSLATTAFVAPAFNNVGRNLVHNSMFNVQQRGVGPFTATGVISADRWVQWFTGGSVATNLVATTDTDRTQIGDEAARFVASVAFTGTGAAG